SSTTRTRANAIYSLCDACGLWNIGALEIDLNSGGKGKGGVRRLGRQPQGEGRSDADRGVDVDAAAVVDRDVLDDGEAEPGATGVPRAGLVGAVEPFEDAVEVLGRDADALVADRDIDHVGGGADLDDDGRLAGRVRDRVLDEIRHGGDELAL